MIHFPHLPRIRVVAFLFVLVLFTNCKKESTSINPTQQPSSASLTAATAAILSQTRTATLFNYNLEGQLVTNYTATSKASDVALDDGVYAYSKKLTSQDGYSLLVLEGFNFTIPSDATIENIIVKARRFKTGTCGIWETTASLVMKRERQDLPEWWDRYGARWADPNYFSNTETEVNYSQGGSGAIGANGQPYQWTPVRINDPYFGVLFQTASVAKSKGFSVISYDLVDITVQYSLP